MSREYKIGDKVTAKIEKVVPRGFGIGFAEDLTVFVELAVPGDVVTARIYKLNGRTAFAEIASVIEPGGERIEPLCKYFGACGGCDFQQMSYRSQLEAKVGIVRDSLVRIGKFDPGIEISIIPSPKEFEYRSRAQWHFDTRSGKIGYFRRHSREVIDVENCPKLVPALNTALTDLRSSLEGRNFWSENVHIEAAAGDGGEVSISRPESGNESSDISYSVYGERFFYTSQSFFQGNQYLIERLLDAALSGTKGEIALDLYCGVGLFTLPLARLFGRVVGVEENPKAVDFAEKNAKYANLENIAFVRQSVREYLNSAKVPNADLILLDPPRAGTEKVTIANIIKIKPKQISYVSCEPSILARDLRTFVAAGYSIESITAVDLFPQTHHVETVARLVLGAVE